MSSQAKTSATLLLGALALCGLYNCTPQPHINDFSESGTILAAVLAPRGQCLIAGLNDSVASGGMLACLPLDNYACTGTNTFSSSSDRTAVTDQINQIGVDYNLCLTPASNALTQINSLSLPASLYMNVVGGTTGPHNTTNYTAQPVASCASLGLVSSSFLGGASSLIGNAEMSFLSSARGLVAIQDTVGDCRNQMGLSTTENSIITGIQGSTAAYYASCDYGADDATRTDCPASLQNDSYMFSSISAW